MSAPQTVCRAALIHPLFRAQALSLWTRLYDGDLKDPQFPGLGVIVDCLCCIFDKRLLFQYAAWVLKHDAVEGVLIFKRHCTRAHLVNVSSASLRRTTVAVRGAVRTKRASSVMSNAEDASTSTGIESGASVYIYVCVCMCFAIRSFLSYDLFT